MVGPDVSRLRLPVDGGEIEYEWLAPPGDPHGPTLVFLHEGLGSIDLWRRFPADVVARTGHRAVVYSRLGYGWSTPVRTPRAVEYMHHEAHEVLPLVLDRLEIDRPVLVGHSDGASIALLFAGSEHETTGLVLLAPHVFVEQRSTEGIAEARNEFELTDLGQRMAKYHHDPQATFRGWNDVWASDSFRQWNIVPWLSGIACPVLCVQGLADAYGTVAQLDAIEDGTVGPVERIELAGCGHAPHLERADDVTDAVADFVAGLVTDSIR